MKYLAILPIAAVMALVSPAHVWAKPNPTGDQKLQKESVRECLEKLGHPNEDLSKLSKQTRDRLINNPSQIDLVVDSASSANDQDRPQIELGIVRAVEYLKCVDPAGYQAITAYLNAHSDNQVVADINNALGSEASVGGNGGGGGGGGGLGGGGGGFAGGGPTVSQH